MVGAYPHWPRSHTEMALQQGGSKAKTTGGAGPILVEYTAAREFTCSSMSRWWDSPRAATGRDDAATRGRTKVIDGWIRSSRWGRKQGHGAGNAELGDVYGMGRRDVRAVSGN